MELAESYRLTPTSPKRAEGWSEPEVLLIHATDQLHEDAFITDIACAGLTQHYSTQQLMDIVFTVDQFIMVSMALSSFGVQLNPDVTGTPE